MSHIDDTVIVTTGIEDHIALRGIQVFARGGIQNESSYM